MEQIKIYVRNRADVLASDRPVWTVDPCNFELIVSIVLQYVVYCVSIPFVDYNGLPNALESAAVLLRDKINEP